MMKMNKIILEANELFKSCGFPYYFCGGFALEMFVNQSWRLHSDLDISIFEENRKDAVALLLENGWHVYQRGQYQKQIFDASDPLVLEYRNIWALKPESRHIALKPIEGEENLYDYEQLEEGQKEFTFIEMVVDVKDKQHFLLGKERKVKRCLDKAILFKDGVPYMAPELVLFLKSHPSYLTHEFHHHKTPSDFEMIIPALGDESRAWLIRAL